MQRLQQVHHDSGELVGHAIRQEGCPSSRFSCEKWGLLDSAFTFGRVNRKPHFKSGRSEASGWFSGRARTFSLAAARRSSSSRVASGSACRPPKGLGFPPAAIPETSMIPTDCHPEQRRSRCEGPHLSPHHRCSENNVTGAAFCVSGLETAFSLHSVVRPFTQLGAGFRVTSSCNFGRSRWSFLSSS